MRRPTTKHLPGIVSTCVECGARLQWDRLNKTWIDDDQHELCPASDGGNGPVAFHNPDLEEGVR